MVEEKRQQYIVRKKIAEAPDVSTLELTLVGGGVPSFVPGQYITVYFPETGVAEGKAYSISSAPPPSRIFYYLDGRRDSRF